MDVPTNTQIQEMVLNRVNAGGCCKQLEEKVAKFEGGGTAEEPEKGKRLLETSPSVARGQQ